MSPRYLLTSSDKTKYNETEWQYEADSESPYFCRYWEAQDKQGLQIRWNVDVAPFDQDIHHGKVNSEGHDADLNRGRREKACKRGLVGEDAEGALQLEGKLI